MDGPLFWEILSLAFVSGSFVATTNQALKGLRKSESDTHKRLDRIEAKIDKLPCTSGGACADLLRRDK